MKNSIIYNKASNSRAVREKIKEYKRNSYETMLRITEISHTIAEKYDLSPATMLLCEISVYEHDDVVHCMYSCAFNKTEKFSYGFIEMFFSLRDFEKRNDAIVKIFEKTQEHRSI